MHYERGELSESSMCMDLINFSIVWSDVSSKPSFFKAFFFFDKSIRQQLIQPFINPEKK